MDRAGERVDAVHPGRDRDRQAAGRQDQKLRRKLVAAVGAQPPAARGFVEGRGRHPRVERDVGAQPEPVGDVLQVAQDFGLGSGSARATPTPAGVARRNCRSTPWCRCRSGRRDSGSSTRCRPRRRPPPARARSTPAAGSGAACTDPTPRRQRSARRTRRPCRDSSRSVQWCALTVSPRCPVAGYGADRVRIHLTGRCLRLPHRSGIGRARRPAAPRRRSACCRVPRSRRCRPPGPRYRQPTGGGVAGDPSGGCSERTLGIGPECPLTAHACQGSAQCLYERALSHRIGG